MAEEKDKVDDSEDEEGPHISLISKEYLEDSRIMEIIYNNKKDYLYAYTGAKRDYSWDNEPEFYALQAFRGFISVSHNNEILLPEIQKSYCVLDWKNLNISKSFIKKIRKETQNCSFELALNQNIDNIFDGIDENHKHNWLKGRYRKVLKLIQGRGSMPIVINGKTVSHMKVVSVELTKITNDQRLLVGGEVGYIIGNCYTSLTGFCIREKLENKHLSSYGTIQLLALGKLLAKTLTSPLSFWNLGHPPNVKENSMLYKRDIGGHILERDEFLKKWKRAVVDIRNTHETLQDPSTLKFDAFKLLTE